MIRLSAGTAAFLRLTNNRMDAYPTTAYLLSGKNCRMSCAFCPQGNGENEALKRLGRISWPEYTWDEVKEALSKPESKGLKRVCLQSVRHREGIEPLLDTVQILKKTSGLPLSLSAWIADDQEAADLIDAGVDRISVSIDVINPYVFESIKGGSQQDRLKLLLKCAERLPGKMSTHLICGLGETEFEALKMIDMLLEANITIALFAFVPLRGTAMENLQPPPIDFYRRIQAGSYLLKQGRTNFDSFEFDHGRLVSFGLGEQALQEVLSDGIAFQTSGCSGCNRPYYNERPGKEIYNYHRDLSNKEKEQAISQLLESLKQNTLQ